MTVPRSSTLPEITLRDVQPIDLPVFFLQQQDPDALYMAAFTVPDPFDRDAFDSHWNNILHDPTVILRTILYKEEVAGNLASFLLFGQREVGYWLGKAYWGKGIATVALHHFIKEVVTQRPLYARAAADNRASIRVLQKCGFTIVGSDVAFAEARGSDIEELVLEHL